MTIDSSRDPLWLRDRALLIILGLVVLTGTWWLFRPERLFVNVHVDEAAPVGIADSQPVFTGSLKPASNVGEIHGRVNVLKKGNSLELEISNLESKGAQSFDVAIAPGASSSLTARRLGKITVGTRAIHNYGGFRS